MPFPWLLVVNLIIFAAGILLRPKPKFEDAEPTPFAEAGLPSIDPTRRIAKAWGRVPVRSPQVIDVTEYTAVPIKQKIKSFFSSKSIVVGHYYTVGMALGLANGECILKEIYYDDELLWGGSAASAVGGTAIAISAPDFLGGRENGGGIVGTFRFHGGKTTQTANAYLSSFRTDQPAYRSTCYIVLENVEVGETPRFDAFSFTLESVGSSLSMGADERFDGENTDSELNPMGIIYDLMTDDDYGLKIPTTDIDTATFTSAATTLATEGNGMSLLWTNRESVKRMINLVDKQVDGLLRFNPTLGKWQYKLLRDDYVFANLPQLTVSNVADIDSFTRAQWSDTVNQVQINWNKRGQTDRPSPAIAANDSNFDRQGSRNNISQQEYPGVWSADLAQAIASREQRILGFPLASADLKVNRTLGDILPGDAVRFTDARLGFSDLVMRVGSVGYGDQEQTQLTLQLAEDIFQLVPPLLTSPPVGVDPGLSGAPQEIVTRLVTDQPYFLNVNDTLQEDKTAGETHKPLICALAPQSNALQYRSYQRQGTDDFVAQLLNDFTPTGTMQAALDEDTIDTVVSMVVESVALASRLTDSSTNMIKNEGSNLALIGNEWVAYETAAVVGSTVTLGNVHRGVLDTPPEAHSAGARVWFVSEGAGTTVEASYNSTDSFDIRLTNFTTRGETLIAAASTSNFQFRNRTQRPLPPGNFKVADDGGADRYPVTTVWTQDLVFTWAHRDRMTNAVRFQDDVSDSLESGVTYTLTLKEGATTRHTEAGMTGTTFTRLHSELVTDGFTDGSEITAELKATLSGADSLFTITRTWTHT